MPRKSKSKANGTAAANGSTSHDTPPPAKKVRLLDDSESSESEVEATLKVNEEYARRFEHNKKREEKQRLEEKYGKKSALNEDDDDESETDSEDDESEDEIAELVTEKVDKQIEETLKAIRNKDPRLFDPNAKFFDDVEEEETAEGEEGGKKEKAMHLKDYHRKNLMEGYTGAEEDAPKVKTFAEEQEELRREVVKDMHTAAGDIDSDEDDFLVEKPGQVKEKPARPPPPPIELADKDPENFLSNFLASRAWVPEGENPYPALEDDDSEFEEKAEEIETKYNLRFEAPELQTAGRTEIVSHARDAVAKQSVRREEKSARKKAREAKRAKKEEEKRQREIEKARLKQLRIEEVMQKVEKIREVAGLDVEPTTEELEKWRTLLEGDFSDGEWEREMQRRFGDGYYEKKEVKVKDGKEKVKKPEWDDDIDIKDLVPDFNSEDEKPGLSDLLDDDDADDDDAEDTEMPDADTRPKAAPLPKSKLKRLATSFVNSHSVDLDLDLPSTSRFKYRATSPTSFGLTTTEILTAPDSKLNEFAGLKKLADWGGVEDGELREKKARLRRNLVGRKGKKRAKKWREEVFGRSKPLDKEEWKEVLAKHLEGEGVMMMDDKKGKEQEKKEKKEKRKGSEEEKGEVAEGDGNIVEGKRKRRRRK